MLNRQKCILYMMEQADRPVNHLELVKWAFLLAEEMPSKGGTSFYDFIPYHYGPFSFTLFREMDNLVRNGYLRVVQGDNREAWELIPEIPKNTGNLSKDVLSDAARVVQRFQNSPSGDLLNYVYDQFPWYTANSKVRQLERRGVAEIAVYTIGYEGSSIDLLLNTLMQAGVHCIVDVRRNPVARRYGFHKSSLNRLCSKVDIEYVHVPELGIPSHLRQNLDCQAAYDRLFEQYERELLPQAQAQDALRRIAQLVNSRSTALMCMEAEPTMCHRSRVAKAISSMTDLSIQHLQERKCEAVLN
jgi:uncharacterized protein (DUF488 family)